jgi:hypothetical protein
MFDHWEGDLSGSTNPVSLSVTHDMSIKAVFVKIVSLKIIQMEQGIVTMDPSGPYVLNSSVTLTAIPADGWTFRKWCGDLDCWENPVTITMTKNKIIRAIFISATDNDDSDLNPTLSIIKTGQGTVTMDPSGPYVINSSVTLTATPADGWLFSKWSGDIDSSENSVTIKMTENKKIRAEFIDVSFVLKATVSGQGSVTPTDGEFDRGSVVTLQATPADGWTFAGWAGDVSTIITTPTLDVTMNYDHKVTAVFLENSDDSTTDDDNQNGTANDNSENNIFNINDLLSSCSIPFSVILLALFAGFMNLKFGSRE